MKAIYTLKDIQTFLSQKYPKLNWNYEIYDSKSGEKIQASIENFNENLCRTVALACTYKNNEFSLDVSVSNFSFLVYEEEPNIMDSGSTLRLKHNFTDDWISLLLAELGHDYAKELISYCKKRQEQINDNAMQEITEYAQKIKAKAEIQSLPYEKLIQKANNVLSSLDNAEEK